ncbi:hypothetical protein FE782_02090 [Paenibacillus antri]|uniref:SLH domain-containing protein n=1 Tax=Paenibacillus antri TaxID=2582848 RepID=A0A5R9GKU0_9BACL|nr:S-layer homology domain-containing protein [Paenibacillus antri]TLS54158.1 hypothetical protein FE782_02090 [Paenibacillus antri]
MLTKLHHAKLPSLLLALSLSASALLSPATASADAADLIVTIGDVAAKVDDMIEVPVSISQPAAGVASYGMELNYDAAALEVVDIVPSYGNASDPACYEDAEGCFFSDSENASGWLRAAWFDASGGDEPIDAAMELFVVRFHVKNPLALGDKPVTAARGTPGGFSFTDRHLTYLYAGLNDGNVAVQTSNNADLAALTTTAGTIAFAADKTAYNARVGDSTKSVTVTPTTANRYASVTVNESSATSGQAAGAIPLKYGKNDIVVEVTAADGTTKKAYTLSVYRDEDAPAAAGAPKPTTTDATIRVNGKEESAGVATKKQEGTRVVTTVAVDQAKLEQKLAAEGQRSVVTIPVADGSDVVAGELNGQMVANMEQKQAILEIKTGSATYTLPAQQINIRAVSDKFGKDVALQEITVRIEIAKPSEDTAKRVEASAAAGSFELVAPPVDFTVRGTYNGATVNVDRFNAYVARSIAIPEGVDPSRITTGVVVDPDGTVRHVPTKVEEVDGVYYATINSLTNSTYSVVYHPVAFADVATHWSKDAVNDIGSRMVIEGIGGNRFAPDRDVTRAEFAAILVRALGLKATGDAEAPFSDIAASDWYHDAVATAHEYGLANGFEDGAFRPAEKLNREQAMAMVAKAMSMTGLKDKLKPAVPATLLLPFADAGLVSDWAKAGIADSLQAGLVTGRGADELAPQATVTRAEVAVLIRRLLQQSELI